MPNGETPTAIVICLPGLSEFAEKYFETARNCIGQNLGFFVIDWMGQGKSGRYLKDPHKRHGVDFIEDVKDLEMLIQGHVPKDIPLVMLAHSMGGNIGLRYLDNHKGRFKCAGFSAPMLGIEALNKVPLSGVIAFIMQNLASTSYIFGGKGWRAELRPQPDVQFSTDAARARVHNAWCLADPALQVGAVTFGWLYNALKSYRLAFKTSLCIPCFIASAGRDSIVDSAKIKTFAEKQSACSHQHYPNAAHEILMERDEIRDDFFARFYGLIKESIVD